MRPRTLVLASFGIATLTGLVLLRDRTAAAQHESPRPEPIAPTASNEIVLRPEQERALDVRTIHVERRRGDHPIVTGGKFSLDLELPNLLLAGLETAKPGDSIVEEHRADLDRVIGAADSGDELFSLESITWPPNVEAVRVLFDEPTTLREALRGTANAGDLQPGDVLRALEILLAAGLLAYRDK